VGNLFVNRNLNLSKSELIAQLQRENKDLRQLAMQIHRSTVGIPGSKAQMKKLHDKCLSFLNFHRHFSNDQTYFNLFLTLSAADSHWPEFFELFPEGRAHLAKTVVDNVLNIPDGQDRSSYVTKAEDFLWRKQFLEENNRFFDIFF
jgi:hypothetical protein